MGQAEFLFDIRRFTWEELRDKFLVLETQKEAVKAAIAQNAALCRVRLESQYDEVIGQTNSLLVPNARAASLSTTPRPGVEASRQPDP